MSVESERRYESQPDEAYLDRNLLVVAFAKLALHRGLPVSVRTSDASWAIVYVNLPTGQVSWHVPSCTPGLHELQSVAGGLAEWDGHDIEVKRGRLRVWLSG